MPARRGAGKNWAIDRSLATPRPLGFLLVFALAYAGGVIAYLPVLTLLLPMRVELIAGSDRLGVLAATVTAGAFAASGSNILFGWLSDRAIERGSGRRRWAAGGLVAVACGCGLVATAGSPTMLVTAVAAFQVGVNALLAPLLAIMADEVHDDHKGLAGGLLALGHPAAAAVSAALLASGLAPAARFALVPVACAACVTPLLVTRRRAVPVPVAATVPASPARPRDLLLVWSARLLIQIAGNVLLFYVFFYFESITPGVAADALATRVGQLLLVATLLPLPVAVLVGQLSDRAGRRRPFLVAAAALTAIGLIGMAGARHWAGGAIAFAAYAIGSGVFMALHAAFAMQLLPSPRHRGRDLGLLNLANTLPALAGPLLAWRLASLHDFGPLMLALAGLAATGGLVVLGAQGRQ